MQESQGAQPPGGGGHNNKRDGQMDRRFFLPKCFGNFPATRAGAIFFRVDSHFTMVFSAVSAESEGDREVKSRALDSAVRTEPRFPFKLLHKRSPRSCRRAVP